MNRTRRKGALAASVALVLVVAACSSDKKSDSTTATTAATTTAAGGSAATTAAGGSTAGTVVGSTAAPITVGTTAAGSEQPVSGGTLTIAAPSNPSSLDPILGGSGNDHMSLYPLYDRLVNFDPQTLVAQPGLATKWTFTDPQTLVLDLRAGVQFQDGTPFNAEAVKYNLERGLNNAKSTEKSDLSMIASVDATTDSQATIHLNRVDTSLVLILADRAGMMVSPTAAKASNDDLSQHPVGAGPFSFVEWQPNDHLTLKKNPTYWQAGKPYLDGINMRYIADQQTAVNAVKGGEADFMMKVDPSSVADLKNDSDLVLQINPSLGEEMCYFNPTKAPFDNVDVRRAVEMAIDRDALNQAYTFGLAQPATEIFPPGYWAADPSLQGGIKYDKQGAKDLLAKAGFANGLDIKGVIYNASSQTRKNEIIQSQLKDVGINYTFDTMEVGPATSTFFGQLTYDLYCAGWSGRPDPSQTVNSLFDKSAFYNPGHLETPGMQDALVAASSSSDQAVRAKALSTVIKISQDQALFIPMLHQSDIDVYTKKVGGFVPNLYGKIDASFLWLKK